MPNISGVEREDTARIDRFLGRLSLHLAVLTDSLTATSPFIELHMSFPPNAAVHYLAT